MYTRDDLLEELNGCDNLPVLLGKDAEGNGYNFARGVDIAWVTADLETLYDSLEEADDDGYPEEDLTQVLLVYP